MADYRSSWLHWSLWRNHTQFWQKSTFLSDQFCESLQTLAFTIAVQKSAQYAPTDRELIYWVVHVGYVFVAIEAIWALLLTWSTDYQLQQRIFPKEMAHTIFTSIVLVASIRLRFTSHPDRKEFQVCRAYLLSLLRPTICGGKL